MSYSQQSERKTGYNLCAPLIAKLIGLATHFCVMIAASFIVYNL
jgi:hypothetical protein